MKQTGKVFCKRIFQRVFLFCFLVLVIPPLRSRLYFLLLDLLSVPGALANFVAGKIAGISGLSRVRKAGLKINALWHLKIVCPLCSFERRSMRDPERKGNCLWKFHWENARYEIPPTFGFLNWLIQYYDGQTQLEDFENLFPSKPAKQVTSK